MGTAIVVNELDALIEVAGKRGFLWHQFRVDRHGPEVLAGVFQWRGCADVVVLVDDEGSHAYRMPTGANTGATIDVFAPSLVHWWYGRSDDTVALRTAGTILPGVDMRWVLRALLALPAPDEPGGLPALVPVPPGTGVPGDRVPVRVRRWLGR